MILKFMMQSIFKRKKKYEIEIEYPKKDTASTTSRAEIQVLLERALLWLTG